MEAKWHNMTEDEKDNFCRNSSCPYYYSAIGECMCDEEGMPNDMSKMCETLK